MPPEQSTTREDAPDQSRTPISTAPSAAPAAPADRVHLLALGTITLALVALAAYVTVPFLPAITWGIALAIIAWPLHAWLHRRLGNAGLAAFLSMSAVIVLILGPMAFVSYQLARETVTATERVRAGLEDAEARESLSEIPGVGRMIAWMERVNVDVETESRKLFAGATRDIINLAQGSLAAVFQFLIAMYVLFHVLRDRELLMRSLRGLLPMSRAECGRVFDRAAGSVHANLYATVVTGLINGLSGGLVFWAVGLPAPLLWGVIMTVLSIMPILGTPFVWVPALIYLVITGQYLGAILVLAFGVLSFMIVGNIIYCRLSGNRMHMHEIPAMISFLGGLAVFGITGVILGPAIYAVAGAIIEVWQGRMNTDSPEPIPPREQVVSGQV